MSKTSAQKKANDLELARTMVVGTPLSQLISQPSSRLVWLKHDNERKILYAAASLHQITSSMHVTATVLNDIMQDLGLSKLDQYVDVRNNTVFDNVAMKILRFYDYNMPKYAPLQNWTLSWLGEWDGDVSEPTMADKSLRPAIERQVPKMSPARYAAQMLKEAAELRIAKPVITMDVPLSKHGSAINNADEATNNTHENLPNKGLLTTTETIFIHDSEESESDERSEESEEEEEVDTLAAEEALAYFSGDDESFEAPATTLRKSSREAISAEPARPVRRSARLAEVPITKSIARTVRVDASGQAHSATPIEAAPVNKKGTAAAKDALRNRASTPVIVSNTGKAQARPMTPVQTTAASANTAEQLHHLTTQLASDPGLLSALVDLAAKAANKKRAGALPTPSPE